MDWGWCRDGGGEEDNKEGGGGPGCCGGCWTCAVSVLGGGVLITTAAPLRGPVTGTTQASGRRLIRVLNLKGCGDGSALGALPVDELTVAWRAADEEVGGGVDCSLTSGPRC